MTNHDKSLQLALLHISLDEVQAKINHTLLPLCAHLAAEETAEMAQTLNDAAEAIQRHLSKWQLQAVENKKG